MNDQFSFNNIDGLLFQFALQTRELSLKKNEINQQINVCRADIAERRSYIETIRSNIKKLEEEIRVKQSTLFQNKSNAKSMKATNSLLRQYEQTLKEELESRKASYKHDMEVYEEEIANYRKIFLSHEEYYCQSPLAQKLLMLQADKEEIESRIKACGDEITMKQKELDHLSGPAVNCSSSEELPESVSGQQHIEEPEKQRDPPTEDSDCCFEISSLHLHQTQILQNVDANAEEIYDENEVQGTTDCCSTPEEASGQLDKQTWQDGMHTEEQDNESVPEDQVLEQQSTVSLEEEVEQEEIEEGGALEEEQAPSKEDEELAAFPESSSHETNPQSPPPTVKAKPSTPTFTFSFSPGSSPHQGTSDDKSPAFPFSLNSGPSTPGFSGFGFDVGSLQDEESPFTFTGSFFNEKKNTESKSSSCSEFLFGQQGQSEDFQFPFTSKSPQTTNKDNAGDDFPFSLNF